MDCKLMMQITFITLSVDSGQASISATQCKAPWSATASADFHLETLCSLQNARYSNRAQYNIWLPPTGITQTYRLPGCTGPTIKTLLCSSFLILGCSIVDHLSNVGRRARKSWLHTKYLNSQWWDHFWKKIHTQFIGSGTRGTCPPCMIVLQ